MTVTNVHSDWMSNAPSDLYITRIHTEALNINFMSLELSWVFCGLGVQNLVFPADPRETAY